MKPDETTPDAELVRRALTGEQRAFSHLVARHKHWLFRFVRRHVSDADEAYDVVQDALVSAMLNLGQYDPQRPIEAWLRRIAFNKCRDRARYNAVRRLFGVRGLGAAETAADPAPGADVALAANAALSVLDQAIRALPAGLREPLVLTALDGLSHHDAGVLLGISAKAVEVRVYRAKRRLAEQLDRAQMIGLMAR